MATKPKRPTFVSPKGTFKYPSLTKPDFGNDAFPKPDGEFKTAIVIPMDSAAQAFIDKLMPAWTEAVRQGHEHFAKLALPQRKKLGALKEVMFYEEEFDKETEEPTGNIIFKAKTKYKILDKKTNEIRLNKISLFDAKGKPLAAGTAIYGGTVGKISFQPAPYWVAGTGMAGITFYLNGAQVIDLVGPGNRSAASMGFGEEEGYEAGDGSDEPPFDGTGEDGTGTPANGNPQDF